MAYLLDANVLITAHRQWYGFDFVPGFWSWIKQAHAANLVSSIARVRDELAGDDALAAWVQQLPGSFFVRESASDGAAFQRVAAWAQSQQYQASAVLTFLQGADFGLVAQALSRGDSVVTLEVRSNAQRIIKIPDACAALGVPYLTPYALLRRERARFVLAAPPSLDEGSK